MHINSAMQQRAKFKKNKYGMRRPKILEEVYPIDREINTTIWRDAIRI